MFPIKIKNYLYRTKSFWLTKKWLEDRPVFLFWKTIFKGHHTIENNKTSLRLLLPTLFAFGKTIIYAVVIIAILQSYSYFFPTKIKFDKGAIDTFLAAIASITGVFLGLYFTAISSIASSFLIKATQDIRKFFLLTPKGQQYVQTVALTGVISLFYIVTKSFGYTIHPISIIFLSLLTAYIIIRFWTVGSDVFNSLEPTDSLPWVTKDIADSIKNVAPPGFQWTKPAIQNHQRRLAVASLDLANNLITFGIKEIKLPNEQLIIALKYLGGILFFYSDFKGRIPTNSFWYKTKNQFESWTLANSTEIALALNTGTSLQPKTIKDFTWFEEQTLEIIVKIFKHFIDEKNFSSTYQAFEIFVGVAEIYGKDLDEQGLKMLLQKLDESAALIQPIINANTGNQITDREFLAFVDTQGRIATAALLGLMKYLDTQTADKIVSALSKINWVSDESSIYLTGLPFPMISRLESIAQELKNEKIIEGDINTQDWYIKTLCFQRYLFSLQSYFNYIKTFHQDYFQKKFEKLLIDKQLPLAIQFIQRWVEFSNKYQALVSIVKKHVEDCNRFYKLNDLPWVTFNFEEEQTVALNRMKEVADRMIALLPKLKDLVIDDSLPDYFGQALTMGVNACFEACDDNDHMRLKKIFPLVFLGSLSAHEITRQKIQDWNQEESKIIFSTEPLINLFEVTGYAKLYAELYQNQELWNVAQSVWDNYLKITADPKGTIEFVAAICNYRDSLFKIMPQATLRTNWQITFEQRMRERSLPVFPDDDHYSAINGQRRITHPSPLIRVIAKWGGLRIMTSAQNIFFATYLSTVPAAVGVKFPDKHDLRAAIQEEEQRTTNEIIDEDE